MQYLPLVSREWKNGSNSSYNCSPFLHSLLSKGKNTLNLNHPQPLEHKSSTHYPGSFKNPCPFRTESNPSRLVQKPEYLVMLFRRGPVILNVQYTPKAYSHDQGPYIKNPALLAPRALAFQLKASLFRNCRMTCPGCSRFLLAVDFFSGCGPSGFGGFRVLGCS